MFRNLPCFDTQGTLVEPDKRLEDLAARMVEPEEKKNGGWRCGSRHYLMELEGGA
ncbi:MAG TPA: hypothetical protein VM784_07520 [Actinomycetota bacterium]|jgi:hypothetical protein|nr:hypothetical protein [Actinomycetota bacterium]